MPHGLVGIATSLALTLAGGSSGPILLADDAFVPRVTVSWTTSSGEELSFEADLPYSSPAEREHLGLNLEGYVALGGTRLEKGAGHPDGAILRVGLRKAETNEPLFEDIANGSAVTITVSNAVFNQAVVPDIRTALQRMEYQVDDVVACGLTIDQTEMFNLASPDDDMGGFILPSQIRFSALDGSRPNAGRVDLRVEPDGSVTMIATIPYGLFRHKGDPWRLEVPGTFFEPIEMDIEIEVLPADIAAAEGVRLRADPAS